MNIFLGILLLGIPAGLLIFAMIKEPLVRCLILFLGAATLIAWGSIVGIQLIAAGLHA